MNERDKPEMALWERQPGEGQKPYEAARIYFELGPSRSLAEVARVLGKHRETVRRYSTRFQWRERARAFDAHRSPPNGTGHPDAPELLKTSGEAHQPPKPPQQERTRSEMEWEMSQALLVRVREMLAVPLDELRWSPRDVAVYFDLAMDLMQRAAETMEDTADSEGTEAAEGPNVVTVRVTYVDEGREVAEVAEEEGHREREYGA